MSTYVAIDFETADYKRDSACAVGLVKFRNDKVIDEHYQLIRPPRREFIFSYLHGITWGDVKSEPDFKSSWTKIDKFVEGSEFFLAHNASFDRSVLRACCSAAALQMPSTPFICTVKIARDAWSIYPTKLPDVCRELKIDFKKHHHAAADAMACAQIALAALRQGHPLSRGLLA